MLVENKTIEIIGHRGNMYVSGENTLTSMMSAFDAGAHAVELDVQMAFDSNIPVIYHDTKLGGSGFLPAEFEASKQIKDYTLDELQQIAFNQTRLEETLSAQAGKPVQLELEATPHIPTLSEVLAILPADKKLYIELKRESMFTRSDDALAFQVIRCIKQFQKQDQVVLISFNLFDLEQVAAGRHMEEIPGLQSGLNITDELAENITEIKALKSWLKIDYWSPPFESANPLLVKACHELGMKIIPWVRQESMQEEKIQLRRLMQMEVDGIMTNQPAYFLKLLQSR